MGNFGGYKGGAETDILRNGTGDRRVAAGRDRGDSISVMTMEETPKHLAILAFNSILQDFPLRWQKDAPTWCGLALGTSPDPTGLEPTMDRTINQLYWDITVEDIVKRMVELVEETELDEQMVVMGTVAFIDHALLRYCDPENIERMNERNHRFVDFLREQRNLPIESRRQQDMTDERLDDFIRKLEEAQDRTEVTDSAQEALDWFRSEVDRLLNSKFWFSFEAWRAQHGE